MYSVTCTNRLSEACVYLRLVLDVSAAGWRNVCSPPVGRPPPALSKSRVCPQVHRGARKGRNPVCLVWQYPV